MVGWLSVLVGLGGVLYHLESRFFLDRTLKSLTYAAPFAAPLAYTGLGFLLLMNRMVAARSAEWARWVIFLALGGFFGNFVLSLTDHASNGFFAKTEWIPVISSALATGFLIVPLVLDRDAAIHGSVPDRDADAGFCRRTGILVSYSGKSC